MLPVDLKHWLAAEFGDRVRFDEPMRDHTSFRIGGPADALVFPETTFELAGLIRKAATFSVSWVVIGGGTNLLVKDHGVRGMVITTVRQESGLVMTSIDRDTTHIRASAGTSLNTLCRMACDNGLQGMSFALGIPGTVGGAIVMNAGTDRGAMQDVLVSVDYVDENGRLVTAGRNDLSYAYRSFSIRSRDTGQPVRRPIIVEAVVEVRTGDRDAISAEMDQVLRRRRETQPGWRGNAGCFFRNPSSHGPAGKLIDQAGFKGYRVGGAKVAEEHANFIVNTGEATAEDVLSLSREIQEKVFSMFQVRLEPEVRVIG